MKDVTSSSIGVQKYERLCKTEAIALILFACIVCIIENITQLIEKKIFYFSTIVIKWKSFQCEREACIIVLHISRK